MRIEFTIDLKNNNNSARVLRAKVSDEFREMLNEVAIDIHDLMFTVIYEIDELYFEKGKKPYKSRNLKINKILDYYHNTYFGDETFKFVLYFKDVKQINRFKKAIHKIVFKGKW